MRLDRTWQLEEIRGIPVSPEEERCINLYTFLDALLLSWLRPDLTFREARAERQAANRDDYQRLLYAIRCYGHLPDAVERLYAMSPCGRLQLRAAAMRGRIDPAYVIEEPLDILPQRT